MLPNLFCWNCCGAGHKSFLTSFKSYVNVVKFSLAVIIEPKISGSKAARVVDGMGFDSSFRVDARGFKGGIWVVWDSNQIELDVVSSGFQFIHLKGKMESGSLFFITAIYASPTATERVLLWDTLKSLSASMSDPWTVIGDFNSILSASDKRGVWRSAGLVISHSLTQWIFAVCQTSRFRVLSSLGRVTMS